MVPENVWLIGNLAAVSGRGKKNFAPGHEPGTAEAQPVMAVASKPAASMARATSTLCAWVTT